MAGPDPMSAMQARLRGVTQETLLETVNREILPALDELRQKYNIHEHTPGSVGSAAGLVISVAISADQNDWSPTDLATAGVVRVTTDALRSVTGLDASGFAVPLDNKLIINVGAQPLVLVHQSPSSAASNRIIGPGAADLTLQPDESATLWYDIATARYRVV